MVNGLRAPGVKAHVASSSQSAHLGCAAAPPQIMPATRRPVWPRSSFPVLSRSSPAPWKHFVQIGLVGNPFKSISDRQPRTPIIRTPSGKCIVGRQAFQCLDHSAIKPTSATTAPKIAEPPACDCTLAAPSLMLSLGVGVGE